MNERLQRSFLKQSNLQKEAVERGLEAPHEEQTSAGLSGVAGRALRWPRELRARTAEKELEDASALGRDVNRTL